MHRQRTLIRRVSGISLGLGLGLAVVASVFAHAEPAKFTPGNGAILTAVPAEVSLDTTEEMSSKPGDNDLIVDNAQGQKVTTSAASVDAAHLHMSVPLPAGLPNGAYSVRWYTVGADDGHPAQGKWTFTVDPAGKPVAGTQPEVEDGSRTQWYAGGGLVAILVVVTATFMMMRRKKAPVS